MLLVVDIGNTNTVMGIYDGDKLKEYWRLTTSKIRTSDEYAVWIRNFLFLKGLKNNCFSDALVSCVVPPSLPALLCCLKNYWKIEALVLDPRDDYGMPVLYENPSEVGADRIANALGALKHYEKPVIIVDFGTATTFCGINEKGEYLGGIITPGIQISSEALFQRASKLPRVSMQKPDSFIGTTTVGSIQSGLYYGYLSMIDGIIERMDKDLGGAKSIIATGGYARFYTKDSRFINCVDDQLTLKGLKIAFDRMKSAP